MAVLSAEAVGVSVLLSVAAHALPHEGNRTSSCCAKTCTLLEWRASRSSASGWCTYVLVERGNRTSRGEAEEAVQTMKKYNTILESDVSPTARQFHTVTSAAAVSQERCSRSGTR